MSDNDDIATLVSRAFSRSELRRLMDYAEFAEFLATVRTVADFEHLCWLGEAMLKGEPDDMGKLVRMWNAKREASERELFSALPAPAAPGQSSDLPKHLPGTINGDEPIRPSSQPRF